MKQHYEEGRRDLEMSLLQCLESNTAYLRTALLLVPEGCLASLLALGGKLYSTKGVLVCTLGPALH